MHRPCNFSFLALSLTLLSFPIVLYFILHDHTAAHEASVNPCSYSDSLCFSNSTRDPVQNSQRPGRLQEAKPSVISEIVSAIHVLQQEYFEPWLGTWPDGNDWTRAVHNTHVSAALNAITRHPDYSYSPTGGPYAGINEDTVSGYFNHLTSFYFGENAFSLRTQAYDDMQWVVLGWLEAVKTTQLHSDLHYPGEARDSTWHGKDYVKAFSHRARIFWDLASKGWETSLCSGGMLWSPYGTPYKNAITNELYIATSISMYLYFPGDDNDFPFLSSETVQQENGAVSKAKQHDSKYLDAALAAYTWLQSSNMTNSQGLYTDGFHIKGWRSGHNPSNGTRKCDLRDEKVYTYNQGVILTGQRGLWEATGNQTYLEEGHILIRNVIAATGYDKLETKDRHRWAGLGRNGILEETCDSSATCSQNSQTFKSIFFHHLATFCEPLPVGWSGPVFHRADKFLAALHRQSCKEYGPWISRNAQAALGTRNAEGKFGEWWTIGLEDFEKDLESWKYHTPQAGTDYRTYGLPMDPLWRMEEDNSTLVGTTAQVDSVERTFGDPNDRGRGRTVETQSGGLSVLYALFRIVELQEQSGNPTNLEL